MIIDNINNIETYRCFPKLYKILKELHGCFSCDFPKDQIVLEEASLFINPVTLTTKPAKECIYEAHKLYSDVHFIIEGHERIMISPLNQLSSAGDFDDVNDIGFYKGNHQTDCLLSPGDFLVCFPHDGHKVAIMDLQPEFVKKLVGKIKN